MDFGFSEEQDMLREATRRLLETELPVSRVRELADDADGFDRAVWRKGADLGWYAMLVPEEHGGTGGSIVDLVVVAEEMGRVVSPGPFLPVNVVALALAEAGSAEQRATVLPALASGETTAAWCVSEDDGLWDPAGVSLSAKGDADGFTLDGTKLYVQDAHVADHLLVTARLDGALAQLLVGRDTPGTSVRPLQAMDITRRLCEVTFEGAHVPAAALVGVPGAPTEAALERQLQAALVLTCAESVGGSERMLEMTVQYAKDRVQFGRPIGSFQAIKHKCANMLVWLEASKAATYYAALAFQDRLDDAPEAASIAKSYVGDAFTAVTGEGLQIHGGIGFTWEHDVHLYLRRAKSNEVLYGTPSWHRERLCTFLEG